MTIFYPVFYPMSPHPVKKKFAKCREDKTKDACSNRTNDAVTIKSPFKFPINIFGGINLRIVQWFFNK